MPMQMQSSFQGEWLILWTRHVRLLSSTTPALSCSASQQLFTTHGEFSHAISLSSSTPFRPDINNTFLYIDIHTTSFSSLHILFSHGEIRFQSSMWRILQSIIYRDIDIYLSHKLSILMRENKCLYVVYYLQQLLL